MNHFMGLPQFNSIDIAGFQHHLEVMLKRHLNEIEQLLDENARYTWDNLMYRLEDLDDEFEQFWSPFSHLHSVMNSKAIRTSYEACLPLITAYKTAIGQNQKLYQAIKSIDTHALDSAQKKIISDALIGFQLSGVALSASKRKRFEAIETRLSELSNQFSNNILDAEKAFSIHITDEKRLQGLPEHALHAARELAEDQKLPGFVLNLEFPCYRAVMSYCEDRALREQMYVAYTTRASDVGPNPGTFDNSAIINEILALRHEQAELLGFENYAALSLATKMAASTDKVIDFLEDLVTRARPQGKKELEDLQHFAKKYYYMDDIKPWDVGFLSEKNRKLRFDLSQEELRPYFPLPKVMNGVFSIIKTLYGMTMQELHGEDVWHKDVQCYVVVDEKNKTRGYIYTDLFARQNKRNGAWMDSLRSRRLLQDGHIQIPIATLTCNFAKPTKEKPAQLSHDEVLTLFHELGHCLHHILTQVDYLSAAGINGVEWDAVELPSQFFENWAWDKQSLKQLTAHEKTHEPLPDALYEKLIDSKNYQSAMAMLRQMEFSLFDFKLHLEYTPKQSDWVNQTLKTVRTKTSLLPAPEYNRVQNSFSHIFDGGYAAGYYSYSWAEVLSCDAFSRFEEEGILNPITGREFLHHILEVGGSMNANEAFTKFRGREARIDALLRHNGIVST